MLDQKEVLLDTMDRNMLLDERTLQEDTKRKQQLSQERNGNACAC